MTIDGHELPPNEPEEAIAFDGIELAEDDLTREEYAWGRVTALAGVGAVMLAMGQNYEDMPAIFHTEVGGTPMIDFFRHVFPAVTLTAFSEWYTDTSSGDTPRPLRWIPAFARMGNSST